MQTQSMQAWQQAERMLKAQQYAQARTAYEALLTVLELSAVAHLRLSLIASRQGRHRDAVDHALRARQASQPDAELLDMVCKRLFSLGELEQAVAIATSPEMLASQNPVVLAELGKLMSDAMLPDDALPLLRRARELGLDSAALRYLVGLSLMYTGDLEGAETELEAALVRDPAFAHAYWSLAKLRRQVPERNHVDRLRAAIRQAPANGPEGALLHYSLFKELDDLDRTDEAWNALEQAMRLRRAQLPYDPASSQALFDYLQSTATPDVLPAHAVDGQQTPIFIVGMPRSGTTLLERIVGAHSQVTDAGELQDFIRQLRWAADKAGGPYLDIELAHLASTVDLAVVGRRYIEHTRWRTGGRPYFTDKMPANFINVGYIVRALPQARIVHMTRDPMDTCFSNLKEFFAGPYRYSYDQVEMANYYRGYRQLMTFWRSRYGHRILDVRYADLVADPERTAREVLAFCGLSWEKGLAEVAERSGTVATASAVQVREPIHARSVGQWRRYEKQLQPLFERLGPYAY